MRNIDALLALFMAGDVPFVPVKCAYCVLHHVLATVFLVRLGPFILFKQEDRHSTFGIF